MSGFNNRIPLLAILGIVFLHRVEVCYGMTPEASPVPDADSMKNASDTIRNGISSTSEEIKKGSDEIKSALPPVPEEIKSGSDKVTKALSPVGEAVKNSSDEITKPVEEAIKNGSDMISNAAAPVADAIKNGSDVITKPLPRLVPLPITAPNIDCKEKCFTKCKDAPRYKLCFRLCNTCCQRCGCVQSASEPCLCWDTIVHKGRKRCPS